MDEIVKLEGNSLILDGAKLADISIPTPEEKVKYRKGRAGQIYAYVETSYVIEMLNRIFGWGWDFEILDQISIEEAIKLGMIVVKCKLTVKDRSGHSVSKTAFGSSEVKKTKSGEIIDLADDFKAAASDALKKCASMLGICLDVYSGKFSQPKGQVETIRAEDIITVEPEQQKDKIQEMKEIYIHLSRLGVKTAEAKEYFKALYGKESLKEFSEDEFLDLQELVFAMNSREDFNQALDAAKKSL